jgi:hypothetical protein
MATNKTTRANTGAKKQGAVKKTVKSKPKVTADAIRKRAAEIYHERMQKGHRGDELSDWLQAEKELNGKK